MAAIPKRQAPATPRVKIDDVPGFFGNEQVEPMMYKLSDNQIATLYKYPEEALSRDLVYLIFFNRDIPANHTLRVSNGDMVAHKSQGWRSVSPLDVLRTVASHYKKIIEYAKVRCEHLLGNVDHMKVAEYLRALHIDKNIHVSVNCPIYPHIDNGVISVERMKQMVCHAVIDVNDWTKDDWPETIEYATSNIFDDARDEALT